MIVPGMDNKSGVSAFLFSHYVKFCLPSSSDAPANVRQCPEAKP